VALDGIVLRVEKKANRNFYGRAVTADEIIAGAAKANAASSNRFIAAVTKAVPASAVAGANEAPRATTNPDAPRVTGPAANGSAQSFPMEDKQPGSEPR
jgi:hypothetical protein